jgi:hypothetical protein
MITLTREEAQQVLDALEEINKLSVGENAICLPAEIDDAMETLRARLAQPETPYEIGKRLYREGKGISFIPTAVERDDQIGEALRGFEDARLAQPEPEPVACAACSGRGWYTCGASDMRLKCPECKGKKAAQPQRECKCKHCGGINVC